MMLKQMSAVCVAPLFPFAVKEMSNGAVVVKCAHNFSSHRSPPKKYTLIQFFQSFALIKANRQTKEDKALCESFQR